MRKRPLITSPRDWAMMAVPVDPPRIPVIADRGGTQIQVPKPILLWDSREQDPYVFRPTVRDWFSDVKKTSLPLGDYSIEGMEGICVVERKSLADLVRSTSDEEVRRAFIARMRRMAELRYALLAIDGSLSQIKARYKHSNIDPNRTIQALVAIVVQLGVHVLPTDTHELGAEMVPWYLYNVHHSHWLESNDYGPKLVENDL